MRLRAILLWTILACQIMPMGLALLETAADGAAVGSLARFIVSLTPPSLVGDEGFATVVGIADFFIAWSFFIAVAVYGASWLVATSYLLFFDEATTGRKILWLAAFFLLSFAAVPVFCVMRLRSTRSSFSLQSSA